MNAMRILLVAACAVVVDFAQAQLQEGWSDASIADATEHCTDFFVAMTREGFARKAQALGDTRTTFPEAGVRDSSAVLCDCVVRRAAATWPLADWQANLQDRLSSLVREAFMGGPCKPVDGLFGRVAKEPMEGNTSRTMQEDFDRIRLDHAFVIGALVEEYRAKAGVFPFSEGTDKVPAAVIIGTDEQIQRNKEFTRIRVDFALRATDGVSAPRFERVEQHTLKAFQDELERVLGRGVQLPVDPQQIPVNKPSIYIYVLYRGIYDVSVFTHHEFSFARPLGPNHNKVAIASRSYPPYGFWTAEDLKKEPAFVEFFRKPFNRERYTLKTKL